MDQSILDVRMIAGKKTKLMHGPVMITDGDHKGKTGIYDDDKSESLAIVYLEPDNPMNYFAAPWALIKRSALVNVAAIKPKVIH